jgi:ribokinase
MFMRPKIVVVGSANTDITIQVPRLPKPGETVIGGTLIRSLGGKGANQAVAAARLGGEVTFITCLGKDAFGFECEHTYRSEGIDTRFVVWDEQEPSGVALIMIDSQGENYLAVASGANMHLLPEHVDAAEEAIRSASIVVTQLEVPITTTERAVELAQKHGVPVILNPAPPVQAALPATLLGKVTYLTPNETELDTILRLNGEGETTAQLSRRMGALVVTLGARGAMVMQDGAKFEVPAFAVKAVDTTAAGDAFNGGLAVALGRGFNLPEAVRYACAAGAIAVTRLGAMPSLPGEEEVARLLA